ncbi:hypothetical protein Syun_027584 [Stephania yunnanensis]|uniref:Uncharacterized protein n=1 Tax=Stephania yunnanensis TaxID=152371 RepID=A0AAP0ELC6_9MAGN
MSSSRKRVRDTWREAIGQAFGVTDGQRLEEAAADDKLCKWKVATCPAAGLQENARKSSELVGECNWTNLEANQGQLKREEKWF